MTPALSGGKLAASSEDILVILAMKGDSAAYGELVRRRQSAIRNLLRRLCRSDSLADDLAQQAFIRGWQSIRRLKARGAIGAWLRKLAVNCWLQHLRSTHSDTPLDENSLIDAPLLNVSRQIDLDVALAHLPTAVRLCVVLAYSEGMSHAEISHSTDIPVGTVKSHIHRGTARLRELLQGYEVSHVG